MGCHAIRDSCIRAPFVDGPFSRQIGASQSVQCSQNLQRFSGSETGVASDLAGYPICGTLVGKEVRMTFAPIQCSAPGKVILFGEHAVVYGQPAIAVPVTQVQATATVELAPPGNGLTLVAPDLEKSISLTTAPQDDPLAVAARLTLAHLSVPPPDAVLTIHSTIPIAGGLGSGAATAAAAVRALAIALGHPLDNESINTIVYEVEKIHHGTPSGIDNTVVTMAQPIYFVRGRPIELIAVGATFTILIGDTGVASPTKESVAYVRRQREKHPAHYDALCDQIGDLVVEARQAIEAGDPDTLGKLMDENHRLLIEMGVSSPDLNRLVTAARTSGALGAKLSGGGWGGNMIALVEEATIKRVTRALTKQGAQRVIATRLGTIS